jgi:hypothetical protein
MSSLHPGRRRAVAALPALAAAMLLPACVTPMAPARALNPARAPRPGDSWRYAYASGWRNEPARQLEVRCLEVGTGIRDRLSLAGAAAGEERVFLGGWELVERPLTGFMLTELAPYIDAFDGAAVGEASAVRMPTAGWGTSWSGTARVVSAGPIQTPAGRFDGVQVEFTGSRPYIRGQMDDAIDPVFARSTAWYAPAARRVVRFSHQTFAWRNNPLARDSYELVALALK